MSIKCSAITDFFEEFAPMRLAEDWDNVGLLIGSRNKPVSRIMLCLDVTSKAADEAIEKRVNLIISHHPLIFRGIKRIDQEDFKGDIMHKLIKNDICLYSAHTNLDVAENGVNDCLAAQLGLKALRNLKKYKADVTGKEYGLGRIGILETGMDLEGFVEQVKNKLNIDKLRVIGDIKRDITKVAVFCGSFDDDLSGIAGKGFDVLVTGDIKYHTAQDASEMGMCIIDAGHYNTEVVVLPKIACMIEERFPELEILRNNVEEDPFKFY